MSTPGLSIDVGIIIAHLISSGFPHGSLLRLARRSLNELPCGPLNEVSFVHDLLKLLPVGRPIPCSPVLTRVVTNGFSCDQPPSGINENQPVSSKQCLS